MGKGNCPYQPKQAKYDQGHTNPVDGFVGWTLVVFGIFVEIHVDWSLVGSLSLFGCGAFHTSNIKCYFDPL